MKNFVPILLTIIVLASCKAPIQFVGLTESSTKVDITKRKYEVASYVMLPNSALELAAIKNIKLPNKIIELLKQDPQVIVGNYSRFPFYSKEVGNENGLVNTNILNLMETQINASLLLNGISPFENNAYYNFNYLNNYKNSVNLLVYDVKRFGFVFQKIGTNDSLVQRKIELNIQFRLINKMGKIEIIAPFEYSKFDTLTTKEFQMLNGIEYSGNTFNSIEKPTKFRTGESFVENSNHVSLGFESSERIEFDTVIMSGSTDLMFMVNNPYANYNLFFANGKDLPQFSKDTKKEDVVFYLKDAVKSGKIKSLSVHSKYMKTNSAAVEKYYFNLTKKEILSQLDNTDILYIVCKAKLVCVVYRKPNGELLIMGNSVTTTLK